MRRTIKNPQPHHILTTPHRIYAQKDEIKKIIFNYVALKGLKNIGELTREIKRQRGKASRTTIRKKLKSLVNSKVLVKDGTRYHLP